MDLKKQSYDEAELLTQEELKMLATTSDIIEEANSKDNGKIIEVDRIIMNTSNFATQIIETNDGILVEVFHRHGELIESFTYSND